MHIENIQIGEWVRIDDLTPDCKKPSYRVLEEVAYNDVFHSVKQEMAINLLRAFNGIALKVVAIDVPFIKVETGNPDRPLIIDTRLVRVNKTTPEFQIYKDVGTGD